MKLLKAIMFILGLIIMSVGVLFFILGGFGDSPIHMFWGLVGMVSGVSLTVKGME